jgi:membrane protease YdiL (CAAX protease family)
MSYNFIIAEVQASDIAAADLFSLGIAFLGLVFLCNWFVLQNGLCALKSSHIRRNNMPFLLPYAGVLAYLIITAGSAAIAQKIGEGREDWVSELFTYLLAGSGEIVLLVCFLIAAKKYFVRGLKGFGLKTKGILADAGWAVVNYVTAMPLVLLGLFIVMTAGSLIYGEDFQMTQHESLSTMMSESPFILKACAVFFAVVLAPIFEEVMFRGLFQSAVISITGGRWLGIIITSMFFVMLHPPMHWLGLMGLSVCLGYTYEKSGSLWRAIFVHMIFNGVSTAAALLA